MQNPVAVATAVQAPELKRVQIISGNFNTDNKKNFSGYDRLGQRYFIPTRLMHSNNWKTDADAQSAFPFFAFVGKRTFDKLDEKGKPVLKANGDVDTFTRDQVASVFKTKESVIESIMSETSIDFEIAKAKKDLGVSLGLDESTIQNIMNASI